jgi:hypothetical protein
MGFLIPASSLNSQTINFIRVLPIYRVKFYQAGKALLNREMLS